MLVRTSPTGMVFPTSDRPAGAILGDFDIDGADLKSHHTKWLDEHIVDPAHARRGRPGMWLVDLVGRASRSGSDSHNRHLSLRRLQAVRSYLMPRLSGIPMQIFPTAEGESRPNDWSQYENELDRSVEVRANFSTVSPKRPRITLLIPKSIPWKPRENRKVRDFTLKVEKASIYIFGPELEAGGVAIMKGTALVKLLIRIDEVGTPDFVRFNFEASGPGCVISAKLSIWSIKPGIGLGEYSGAYENGTTHPFATEVDLDAEDFAGDAMFQFDAAGNTLAFGPDGGFFKGQKKIRHINMGFNTGSDPTQYGEGTVVGKLKPVTDTPEWAR